MGKGAFGKAYLVKGEKSGQLLAQKEIETEDLNEEEIHAIHLEGKIMEASDHPNIVKFHRIYKDENNNIGIIMEYCDDKSLGEKLEK